VKQLATGIRPALWAAGPEVRPGTAL